MRETETISTWQSLAFGPNYKAAYCMAVCPAGEEVIAPYRLSKKDFITEIVRPLQAKKETLYVIPGSDAEAHAGKRYPHKELRRVRSSLRPRNIRTFLQGARVSFQDAAAGELDATYHFTFTGEEKIEATFVIRGGTLAVEEGLQGEADLHVTADAATWLGFLARKKNLPWALITRRIRLRGNPKWLLAFGRCFPS